MQFPFLDLPIELRYMIYDFYDRFDTILVDWISWSGSKALKIPWNPFDRLCIGSSDPKEHRVKWQLADMFHLGHNCHQIREEALPHLFAGKALVVDWYLLPKLSNTLPPMVRNLVTSIDVRDLVLKFKWHRAATYDNFTNDLDTHPCSSVPLQSQFPFLKRLHITMMTNVLTSYKAHTRKLCPAHGIWALAWASCSDCMMVFVQQLTIKDLMQSPSIKCLRGNVGLQGFSFVCPESTMLFGY